MQNPNCDLLGEVQDKINGVHEFLEYMESIGYQVEFVPPYKGKLIGGAELNNLVMRAFGIDPVELEKERRSMLKSYQENANA